MAVHCVQSLSFEAMRFFHRQVCHLLSLFFSDVTTLSLFLLLLRRATFSPVNFSTFSYFLQLFLRQQLYIALPSSNSSQDLLLRQPNLYEVCRYVVLL
jgi:hypothetical protein